MLNALLVPFGLVTPVPVGLTTFPILTTGFPYPYPARR